MGVIRHMITTRMKLMPLLIPKMKRTGLVDEDGEELTESKS